MAFTEVRNIFEGEQFNGSNNISNTRQLGKSEKSCTRWYDPAVSGGFQMSWGRWMYGPPSSGPFCVQMGEGVGRGRRSQIQGRSGF